MTEETKAAIRECAEIADTFSDCDGPPSREFMRRFPEAFDREALIAEGLAK